MDFQMIEVYAPNSFDYKKELLTKFNSVSHWTYPAKNKQILIRILVKKEDSESILNYLEKLAQQKTQEFDAMLYTVKAHIPSRLHEKNTPEDNKEEFERASKHELYSVVETSSEINTSFSWFTVFAALVAGVGVIQNSPTLVLGANVIDPSFRPIIGIAFSSVLGEGKLAKKTVITALYAIFIPIGIAGLFGYLFQLPTDSGEFITQTNVHILDLLVAISAGGAGALSFVKRSQGQLVGVMISLAVLPTAVVFGMMVGAARWESALTPLLLLLINVNSILISAIIVLWISGIKPVNWKDIKSANTSRLNALLFTGVIGLSLVIMVILI
ncbi:TIGR00341 family protein [Virgibacillus siamensis]|uniref:TIGR00341 family protein n=1 Tax=Virgibacillus siamensis TaxID=480071 RepID=UPI0009873E81|nr:TIGR00341 family protein [Virgibacillus siamensis]